MQLNNNNKNYIYSDEQLIARFQNGDKNAYVELVNRYRDRLINFVYNYIGDFEISQDIVQDTMVKLYQKKHYYKEINKFSTWLYTIAKNLAFTEFRKKKQRKVTLFSQINKDDKPYDVPAKQPDIDQEIESEITNRIIRKAINGLPEKFKEVVNMRDIDGLSYEEISCIIEVPIGTVKSRINRARLQLQVELKELRK
tara:strand:+ start:91 stop:681 length:591 start_codon:yes stop_codon:yes gene_type:complete